MACHQTAHRHLTTFKKTIAKEFGVPLTEKRFKQEDGAVLHRAKKAACALVQASDSMPQKRRKELKQTVFTALNRIDLDQYSQTDGEGKQHFQHLNNTKTHSKTSIQHFLLM